MQESSECETAWAHCKARLRNLFPIKNERQTVLAALSKQPIEKRLQRFCKRERVARETLGKLYLPGYGAHFIMLAAFAVRAASASKHCSCMRPDVREWAIT
jgi:hypothetical protein